MWGKEIPKYHPNIPSFSGGFKGTSRGNCPLHDENLAWHPLFGEMCAPRCDRKELFFQPFLRAGCEENVQIKFLFRLKTKKFAKPEIFTCLRCAYPSFYFWYPLCRLPLFHLVAGSTPVKLCCLLHSSRCAQHLSTFDGR